MTTDIKKEKESAWSILTKENDKDNDWLQYNSVWALAARRVFIISTDPNQSPYDQDPVELNEQYDTANKFAKGVFFGHPPVKGPLKILFAIGSVVSTILKIPEYLAYVAQLSVENKIAKNFFKTLKFVFSIFSSPVNNKMRLTKAGRPGLGTLFMVIGAMAFTAILMSTGIGAALLGAIGAGYLFGVTALPVIKLLIPGLVVSLLTYGGMNIVTRNIPSRISQKLEGSRIGSIRAEFQRMPYIQFSENANELLTDIMKEISSIEKAYGVKFSVAEIRNAEISNKLSQLLNNKYSQNNFYGLVLKFLKDDFKKITNIIKNSLKDQIHLNMLTGSTATDQRIDYFKTRIIEEVRDCQRTIFEKIEPLLDLEQIQNLIDEKPSIFSPKAIEDVKNLIKEHKKLSDTSHLSAQVHKDLKETSYVNKSKQILRLDLKKQLQEKTKPLKMALDKLSHSTDVINNSSTVADDNKNQRLDENETIDQVVDKQQKILGLLPESSKTLTAEKLTELATSGLFRKNTASKLLKLAQNNFSETENAAEYIQNELTYLDQQLVIVALNYLGSIEETSTATATTADDKSRSLSWGSEDEDEDEDEDENFDLTSSYSGNSFFALTPARAPAITTVVPRRS